MAQASAGCQAPQIEFPRAEAHAFGLLFAWQRVLGSLGAREAPRQAGVQLSGKSVVGEERDRGEHHTGDTDKDP